MLFTEGDGLCEGRNLMFAVIFEVNPRPEAWDDYLGHAAMLASGIACH